MYIIIEMWLITFSKLKHSCCINFVYDKTYLVSQKRNEGIIFEGFLKTYGKTFIDRDQIYQEKTKRKIFHELTKSIE